MFKLIFFLNIMVAEKYIVIKNITGIVVKCIFFLSFSPIWKDHFFWMEKFPNFLNAA